MRLAAVKRRRVQGESRSGLTVHFELVAKLSTEGDLAIQRAGRPAGATNIVIPMKSNLVQL
jgi:hypothetical protein